MTDFLDTTIMVNFVRSASPENYKLMNMKQKVMASAYESGERYLQTIEEQTKLVDNVTNFYLFASEPITISLSDGTTFENMTQFVYGGTTPISVSVSNTSGQTTKVVYAAGLKSKKAAGCTC